MDVENLPTYLFEPNLTGLASLVLTVLLPLLAGLVMKASWKPSVKGVVLLGVAAVKGFVEAYLSSRGGDFDGWTTLYAIGINYGIAVVAYFGLWRGSSVQQGALAAGPVRDSQ